MARWDFGDAPQLIEGRIKQLGVWERTLTHRPEWKMRFAAQKAALEELLQDMDELAEGGSKNASLARV